MPLRGRNLSNRNKSNKINDAHVQPCGCSGWHGGLPLQRQKTQTEKRRQKTPGGANTPAVGAGPRASPNSCTCTPFTHWRPSVSFLRDASLQPFVVGGTQRATLSAESRPHGRRLQQPPHRGAERTPVAPRPLSRTLHGGKRPHRICLCSALRTVRSNL